MNEWLWFLVIVIGALAGYYFWHKTAVTQHPRLSKKTSKKTAGKKKGKSDIKGARGKK